MRGTPVLFDSFTGGLNSAANPYEVKQNEARDLLNVVGTERGGIRKRNGGAIFCPDMGAIDGLYALRSPGNGGFIVSGAGKLQKVSAGGVKSDLKAGLSGTAQWDFTEAAAVGGQGPLYGVNGVDPPQQWNGVAAATSNWTALGTAHPVTGEARLAAVPNGKFCLIWMNRIWIAGLEGDPSALFWTDEGEPNSWPLANITRFDPNDRGPITGLCVCGSYLLVFKAGKIWTVYDDETSANRPLTDNLGTVSPRSLIDTPDGCVFLARDGLYLTNGNSSIKKLSDRVQPTLDAIPAVSRPYAAAAYFDHHYYLSFASPVAGPPNRTLDFDLEQGSWWLHDTLCGNQWAVQDVGAGERLFYAGGQYSYVAQGFVPGQVGNDGGGVMNAHWSSGFHHFGQPALRKHMRQLHFDGYGYIDLYVARDFLPSQELVRTHDFNIEDGLWEVEDGFNYAVPLEGAGEWGGAGQVDELIVYTLGVGRAWSVTVGNQTVYDFGVDSYTLSLTWRKD